MLGSGDTDLEHGFRWAVETQRGRVAVEIGYDDALSHLIIGGCDLIVMPSRFEPCGRTQLYALRYRTLPLVRRVGGLPDTVVDATSVSLAGDSATGFAFGDNPEALMSAIERAAALFRERDIWLRMMRRAMVKTSAGKPPRTDMSPFTPRAPGTGDHRSTAGLALAAGSVQCNSLSNTSSV
jgi:starch synthase